MLTIVAFFGLGTLFLFTFTTVLELLKRKADSADLFRVSFCLVSAIQLSFLFEIMKVSVFAERIMMVFTILTITVLIYRAIQKAAASDKGPRGHFIVARLFYRVIEYLQL